MATRRAKCSECGTRFEFEPGADDHVECPHCGASLATKSASDVGKADPLVGRTLGQFEIVEVIGRGGMGAVYKARQTTLDRFVALKVLPRAFAADASFVERFGREARAAAAVDHPHIIGVYEVGHESGCHYIAMELVEGESLGDALQRAGPLPPERALELLKQAASALGEAHDAGIYHRDIKPSNILLDRWGNARVADFGLAKRPGMDVSVTQTGQSLGTPLYMPPEAARGQPLDARSDLYSLGATFYQALAGRPPFQGSSAAELVGKHLEARVPPLQQVAPDTPPALCRIIHRLLRKQPAQRYQSAHKLLAAIERAEGRLAPQPDDVTRSLPGAPRPSTQHRKPVTRKRPPALVAGIGGGALVVVLLLVFLLSRGGGPPKALTPPPPTKASPQPEAGADEKNAAIVLRNARVCAARGEWQKVGTYLDRLESKYGKTRLYAGSRAAIADLREQATAALRPEPSDPIPAPTVALRRALDMETTGVAALSPDGTYLARTSKPRSGGYHVAPLDGQDKNRWAEWSRIRPNNAMVCLAWGKSDRPLIASGDPHGAVVSRGSGILEYGYKGQTSTIHAVAFSPDGTRLASGSSDKSVWLWDVAAVKTLWKRQPLGCYDGLAFTPDGKTLACGGYADTLHLLDAATGETLRELSGHEGRIRGLAVSPDGSMLAGASEDHTVRLWDIATGTLRHTLAGHTDQVWTVAFSRDGALVASGGNDTTVRLWDARAGRPLATLTDHTAKVRTVAFSSSADVLVTVGQESIRVWDLLPPGTKPTPPQPTPREPRRPLPPPDADGWCGLLDGTSLDGWEPVEAFPGTDAAGPVAVEEGSVVLGQGWPWTGAVWTGAVPSVDYEFEIEGQRVKGTGDFCSVVFPVKDQFCKLNVGGHWPYVIALDTIDGRTGRDGRNPARREASFEDGRWYRVRARVTAERVEAWLDGEQVINLPLDPHELTLFDQYPSMAALKPFGVCTWKTKGAIRNLRLRRLKPDGTPIAPPKPPTPEPPASDYATKSEQVWGLLAERKYTDAQALLAKLAADPAYQGNAALAADRQAATLLAEFWDRVETKLAQMKGRYTRVGDAVGQVMGVADGVVTLKTAKGRVRSPVRELTARQALGFAGLGDEPRDRLLLGTFLLAEGDDPKGADAALAAAGDSPAVAHYRQRLASALDTPKPTPPKPPQGKPKPGQWQSLFDGESLGQWKPVVPDDAPQKARVSVRDGAIVIEGDTYDKGIAWTGDFPSDSYEVAMETMRAAGPTKRVNHEFCDIVFPVGDTTCVLLVGAGGEEADLVALKNVDGKRTEQPPLAGRVPTVEGRWYRIGLRVTPASVRVWVDGKAIIQLPRDRHQLDVQWRHDYLPFGIQAGVKRTLLRNLRVRRLPSGPVKPVEKPGQWRPLFNGKDLSGWTGDTEAWAVERGTLTARGGNKGYLWAEGDYGDFVLELDFRLPKGGNSGIFLRTANPRDPVKTGLEVQLVDPTGQKLEPRYTSGALYGCHAPSRDATRPAGEWNHITVACKGSRIAVEINDRRVNALDLRRWTQRGRNPQGGSTPQPHALKDHPRTGRLGLQNWGTRAWFRNLRIRPLD